jgi:ferric-dicitrate binding protein FerR (iron transport regulator)
MNNNKGNGCQEHKQIDDRLLKKYFTRSCSEEEELQVDEWFMGPDYEKVLKYKITDHLNEYDASGEPDIDGRKLLDRIYHQIYQDEWMHDHTSFLHRAYRTFSKAAAILLIPLLVFGAWYISISVFTRDIGLAEIYSPLGARIHFVLPDGSKGWLNSGSTLKFPVKFTDKTRKVILSGEGYFDVVKNPQKPFVVRSGNLNVIALGTKFDVSGYPADKHTNVVLESGRVVINRVLSGDKQMRIAELEPGQRVSIMKKENTFYKQNVLTDKYVSWKEGMLMFRKDPMTEVIDKINRWYNVNVIIKDEEIKEYRYRATFKDETLDEVLKMMKITSPIDYYIPKRNIKEDGFVHHNKIYLFLKENRAHYIKLFKKEEKKNP